MAINNPSLSSGFALGLGQFMDHKSLATAVYLLHIPYAASPTILCMPTIGIQVIANRISKSQLQET